MFKTSFTKVNVVEPLPRDRWSSALASRADLRDPRFMPMGSTATSGPSSGGLVLAGVTMSKYTNRQISSLA